MEPPFVALRAVTKQFAHGAPALGPVSLAVERGELVSLLGPSGSGKSTLLRLVGGLIAPTSGDVTILGQDIAAAGVEQSFVFQDATLLPWLTIQDNIELPQKLRGVPARERQGRRDRLLQLVHLPEKAHAYPAELSGGQKMRAALARALSTAPRILLLDEPFGALDELTRELLNEELLELRQQQAWTGFFVTHSVTEAVFLSDRVILLTTAPGRVRREFRIDLPQPRTAATRLSRPYQDWVTEISRVLRSGEAQPGLPPAGTRENP